MLLKIKQVQNITIQILIYSLIGKIVQNYTLNYNYKYKVTLNNNLLDLPHHTEKMSFLTFGKTSPISFTPVGSLEPHPRTQLNDKLSSHCIDSMVVTACNKASRLPQRKAETGAPPSTPTLAQAAAATATGYGCSECSIPCPACPVGNNVN